MSDLLFDVLPAGHGVPHAGPSESFHVLHDYEGLLLQSDDGQVVVIQLSVTKGVETRPHRVFDRQAAIVQFPHLKVNGRKSPQEGLNLHCIQTDRNNLKMGNGT